MQELITITVSEQGQPVISSLDVASGLDIRHKTLLETIRTHQTAFEAHFGKVAFETAAVKKKDSPVEPANLSEAKRSTKPITVAYLTEDQALFVGTLSRNSSRVVAFKSALVKSFSEARRRLSETMEPLGPAHLVLLKQAERIAELEQKLNQILDTQQQAARALLAMPRSSEPLPEETTRVRIQRIVNAYCRVKNVGQQEVWRLVYDRLYYIYRVNIRAHRKRSDRESWLDVAERSGHIEKIYTIVSAELINTGA